MSNDRLYTSRRQFLTGSLSLLSAAPTLPLFLGSTSRVLAMQDEPARRKRDDRRILVVVQLSGGNDGLNTIVPYEMDEYYKARRQIAIPRKDALKLEKGLGLHPAAGGLKELFDAGRMAVVQGVGYPNPDRSHFTSMDVWHTADPALKVQEGWLGRYFDACCGGSDPDPEPIEGIALMKEVPTAMHGDRFAPLAFENPEALSWRGAGGDALAQETFRKLNNISGDIPHSSHELNQFLQRAALKAQVGADEIRTAAGRELRGGRRPRFGGGGGSLGGSLQLVARMIAADLPTRIYYVSMGGFDTHTGQLERHRRLMSELGDAMRDFVEELDEQKLLDRVLIMSFSEFGRRVQENASGGTDHGEAAPMFLFGSAVRPGLHGDPPDIGKLHRGDLAYTTDFRRVYATVLQGWLGMRAEKVLGRSFSPLALLKK
jgi:uncharacterized protein (DUF1501 family)